MSDTGFPSPAQDRSTPFNEAPAWSKNAIWYQIFVERFYNGDKSNDPKAANINMPPLDHIAPADWTINSWTGDWYGQSGLGNRKAFQ